MLLTSGSADEFVHQLGTLDAIAGHTNDAGRRGRRRPPTRPSRRRPTADEAAGDGAEDLRRRSPRSRPTSQAKIADYQRQYDALTAAAAAAGRRGARRHAGRARTARRRSQPSGAAQKAVDTALAQVGDPYVWGAGGPDAFDCSGLTQYAYSAAGISLPHSSSSQSQMGTPGLA